MTRRFLSHRSLVWAVVAVIALSGASQWWAGHQERRTGAEVRRLARAGDIRMIGSERCEWCMLARAWMGEHKVPFTECWIESDAQCRADFDALKVPPGTAVFVVRGKAQLGFMPERVLESLQQSERG